MRTTCSVEAYNGVLNDNIVNKGHFFTFIHDIRHEEQIHRDEVEALIESGTGTAKKRRAEYKVIIDIQIVFLTLSFSITNYNGNIYFIYRNEITSLSL